MKTARGMILLLSLCFSGLAFAQGPDLTDLLTKTQLEKEFSISPNDGTDLSSLSSARLQITIHKAASNETLEAVLDGTQVYSFPTSTGREQWETAPSGERDFTSTPDGQFRIFKMVENYYSREWKAPMFHAMFFHGGIAIHGISPDHYAELGSPASGGCVRLTQENAALLWDLVKKTGVRNTIIIVTSN